uniref:Uncharacterized protein n=1 Tax=Verrucosispora sp. MS100047 TaxID=1410949 RepID=A0A097CRI7_9ACTN|nr:hypothetical protein VASRM7_24 [Verrucosispora sp. MS100047]
MTDVRLSDRTDRLKGDSKSLLRAFHHAAITGPRFREIADRRVVRVAPMPGRHPPVTGGW